jgi:peptidoglycan/xylan/chitin deacetylase (PgdA/CDA1 family)
VARWFRLLIGGIICWGVLLGGAAAVIVIRANDAAAARKPLGGIAGHVPTAQLASWKAFPAFRDEVPVLAYHGVGGKQNYLDVSRTLFAAQMLALHVAGFHTITISQYARYDKTGSTTGLPSNPILITFDDGRLDSYRGADQILARYGDTAVMFVVASWPDTHTAWALHWNELVRMQQSGRWQIQEHAGAGHTDVPISATGETGEYYAYRAYNNGHLESFDQYKRRVSADIKWGEQMFRQHIPGYQPLAFAVPYSNYGQRFTNDPRIPDYILPFLHSQFPVVFDGDYLDEGKHRPFEIKGRWDPRLSYRITQGPVMNLPDLYCRLRDYALHTPLWHEYACLDRVPSAHSD